MAAGDVTIAGDPTPLGPGKWLVEGNLEAAAAGTACVIGGLSIVSLQLTCKDDATETAPSAYLNFSDGGTTAAAGTAFVRHSGSGDDDFHFRATILI